MGEVIKGAVHHNYAFWLCLIISIILMIASFVLPPIGEISKSVLFASGELFGFAALYAFIRALDKGLDARIQHNNTSLTIGSLENPAPPQPPILNEEQNENEDFTL